MEKVHSVDAFTTLPFFGALAKLRGAIISFVMFCPSIRTEQLCSHWTDFYEI
jgi:hypothetical protein